MLKKEKNKSYQLNKMKNKNKNKINLKRLFNKLSKNLVKS